MEITIEKLIYGGEGLAHHEGSTVFIPFVLPAERVVAAAVEQKKKFVRAKAERIIDPSPERTAPPCPHFGICGGCDYQHIPYDAQLKYKTDIFRDTLRRIGRIEWAREIATHASPPWDYRNRAQWKVRPLENPASDSGGDSGRANLGIGYFRSNSTALCAVEDCKILSPLLLKSLLSLREALAAGAMPRSLREIEAFVGEDDTKLLLTASFAGFPSHAAELAEKFRDILPHIGSLLFHDPSRDRMELYGPGFVECRAGGHSYRVGHFSFFQVNRFLVDELAREATKTEEPGNLALDLFAGVGLFSLPLARHFKRVLAIEANPAAARDLESNVARDPAETGKAPRGAIEVRSADVDRFLERYREKPDLVLVDPPRAGLSPDTVKHLSRIAPAAITYVSCEPPTLARDLAAIVAGGYDVAEMHLFDLFPQTFHMEAVVRLRKRK
jgi:23S rRNA (uracil1939-C5)-methyltransferase